MAENPNITEAKKSLKHQIKFFQSLLGHIKKGEEPFFSRSMFAAWCLHWYIEERLMDDVEKAMTDSVTKQ